MILSRGTVKKVLEDLVPNDEEELSVLQQVVHCAQLHQRGEKSDLSIAAGDSAALRAAQPLGVEIDVRDFLSGLPETSKRYFYSLAEALDIYQSIKGVALSPNRLTFQDRVLRELRQIRDMCLREGPHAVY